MTEKRSVDLDPVIATSLRNVINEDANISIEAEGPLKGKDKPYPAWNRICAIMDRVQDTAEHLGQMVLVPRDDRECAFDFLDFINHASVLVDCINELARLYEVDLTAINGSCDIFHQTGYDGKGTDKKYFEYLRSLCSVHPVETDRHRSYQDGDFECCPYVAWNNSFSPIREPCDLYALIYTTRIGDHYKTVPIHLREIYQYVESRYHLIETDIIPGIEEYKEKFRDSFRNSPLKLEEEFDQYSDYLLYLRGEDEKRFGGDFSFYYDHARKFNVLVFRDVRNQKLLEKYLNVIKYAMCFQRICLQNVSYEGYENNGIKYPDPCFETTLLDCVMFPHRESKDAKKYSYYLSKASELCSDSISESYYARTLLEHARPFLDKYVNLDDAREDFEYFALTQMAIYADSLENNTLLNRNIPNDLQFRFRVLSDAEWESLHREESIDGSDQDSHSSDSLDF